MNEFKLITRGVIAETLGQPVQRVGHILATRRHIAPIARVGVANLYNKDAIRLVKIEIERIESRPRKVRLEIDRIESRQRKPASV